MQQFAALSIAPQTPPRRSRRTRMFDSPPSSLESTPEADESARLSFDSDLGLGKALGLPPPPPSICAANAGPSCLSGRGQPGVRTRWREKKFALVMRRVV